ncbi:unnamed protein product [Rhizoctonia solani]|uniref:F-box domain-containing protein n=1 Tax=Rhizoctonia solani TaxID=456999 RepID=A0A8H3DZV5_9AGAM|nr:unnamed protein product [Rhizoctonia solani]
MGTRGYLFYHYGGRYYRRYLSCDAYPSGHGQELVNAIPRDPSAFKDWVEKKIIMLENTEGSDEEVVHPDIGETDNDELGFEVTDYADLSVGGYIEWTYVIDLDNYRLVVNDIIHFHLDNLPLYLDDFPFDDISYVRRGKRWPTPDFDKVACQRDYDALQPIVVPASEWGAPIWDELSVSQQFSIEITHQLLRKMSGIFKYAYAPSVRTQIGAFCWNVLCASIPALPFFRENYFKEMNLSPRTLVSGHHHYIDIRPAYKRMHSITCDGSSDSRSSDSSPLKYFWVRGCLVTFCTHLDESIYIAHEVEQMVQKMRLDGHTECVGIILSSQRELVVVAVDGLEVRHSPVLRIRTVAKGPGRASEGHLILTHLLSPPATTSSLPWRKTQPRRSPPASSSLISNLPHEILQIIIGHLDMQAYLALCRVSRSIRLVCVANPRLGPYTVLGKVPEFETIFAARGVDDDKLKMVDVQWCRARHIFSDSFWTFQEMSSKEFDEMIVANSKGAEKA